MSADAGDVSGLRQLQRGACAGANAAADGAADARAKVQQERTDRGVHNAATTGGQERVHGVSEGRRNDGRPRLVGLHDVLHVAQETEIDVLHVPHVRAGQGTREEGPGVHDRGRQRLAEGRDGHIHQKHFGQRPSGRGRQAKTRYALLTI